MIVFFVIPFLVRSLVGSCLLADRRPLIGASGVVAAISVSRGVSAVATAVVLEAAAQSYLVLVVCRLSLPQKPTATTIRLEPATTFVDDQRLRRCSFGCAYMPVCPYVCTWFAAALLVSVVQRNSPLERIGQQRKW